MSNKDKEMQNQNDSFESLFQGIGDGMLPPPKLEQAVIQDSYYQGIAHASTHIRKITGAIVAYAVGVLLFLGVLMLLPQLLDLYAPVATEPSESTAQTTPPLSPDQLSDVSLEYESFGELNTFYQAFGRQNDYPIAILRLEDVYKTKYRFYGKYVTEDAPEDAEYADYQFVESIFAAEAYVDLISTAHGVFRFVETGFYFVSEELSAPINSEDFLEVRKLDNDANRLYAEVARMGSSTEIQSVQGTYGIYAGEQLLMTAWAFNAPRAAIDGKDIFQESIEMWVRNDLFSLGVSYYPWDHEHTYEIIFSKEPTCSADGHVGYSCTLCNASYIYVSEALGHDLIDGACTVCGQPCEHKYVETGSTIYDCIAGQTVAYVCEICYHHDIQEIPGTGAHNFQGGKCTGCKIRCEHDYVNNQCTSCGNICQHEFEGKYCTICGLWCEHEYEDSYCEKCGTKCRHQYETTVSTDSICTEGELTTTVCKYCGYGHSETTLAKGHDFQNGYCTVCKERQKTVTVTDPNVTKGAECLLPQEVYRTYDDLFDGEYYYIDPVASPVFYNVYTYFEGCTITDIRLPIGWTENGKGSVFTIRVVSTDENGYQNGVIATYELVADRDIENEWVLFSGLSIEVPEGCTLAFGWMSDTIWIAKPSGGYIPGYCRWNDYAGSCGLTPLLIDVYGKKN